VTTAVATQTRGIRVGDYDFYLYEYNEEKDQLIVTKSNVSRCVGKELFKCLSRRKSSEQVTVMTKSQVAKAAK